MKNETKMSTSLSNIPRKNAFNVPEGYFEELPAAVLSKCSVSKVKKEHFLMSKPLWWSVAACGLLLLGIWFVVPDTTPSSDFLLALHDFCVTELCDDYFWDLLGSFDFFDLFDYDFYGYH